MSRYPEASFSQCSRVLWDVIIVSKIGQKWSNIRSRVSLAYIFKEKSIEWLYEGVVSRRVPSAEQHRLNTKIWPLALAQGANIKEQTSVGGTSASTIFCHVSHWTRWIQCGYSVINNLIKVSVQTPQLRFLLSFSKPATIPKTNPFVWFFAVTAGLSRKTHSVQHRSSLIGINRVIISMEKRQCSFVQCRRLSQ